MRYAMGVFLQVIGLKNKTKQNKTKTKQNIKKKQKTKKKHSYCNTTLR